MKRIWDKLLFSIVLLFTGSIALIAQQPQLVVQTGHAGNVSSVAFSPDGKVLASSSWDHTIKLWDVASGQELRTFSGHSNVVTSVAFGADGKTLASGSWDDTIKLWDVASGQALMTLSGHSHAVASVAFSVNGKILASGSWDHTIRLWDMPSGQALTILQGHSDSVTSVAFSVDGKTLASGSEDRRIKLWDVASGQELKTLNGDARDITTVTFSVDGKTLASSSNATSSQDLTIKLWDLATGRELRSLSENSGWCDVGSVTFSPDGKILASANWNQPIKFWDVASGKVLRTLSSSSSSIGFSPDGKTLATGGFSGVELWDLTSGNKIRTLSGHSDPVNSISFSPDGRTLARAGKNSVKLWDLANGLVLRTLADNFEALSVAFNPDGRILGSSGPAVVLWDLITGKKIRTISDSTLPIHAIAFSPDGKTFASGGDYDLKLWDVATGEKPRILEDNQPTPTPTPPNAEAPKFTPFFSGRGTSVVSAVAFGNDGKTLVSGRTGDIIRPQPSLQLWDPVSGKELRTLLDLSDGILSVAFSRDGKILANGNKKATINLWDVASGRQLHTLTGHSARISAVAFSPDGVTLVSGSADQTIKLWDVATGRELGTLKGHAAGVTTVAFSLDGRMIVSGSADSTIKLWRRNSDNPLATLISLDKDDWVVVTPDGLFDASPGGRQLLHYVMGSEIITLDQMKNLYYVPGLLQRIMKGDALPKVKLFTAQDLFPEAEYQQLTPGQKTFTVKLKNRGGGIGPAQVLVNGTEVIADARPTGFDPQMKEIMLTIDLSHIKQIVPGKENKVEVIARNATGSLTSKGSARGTELVFVGEGKMLTEPPQLYAIVAGVADYVESRLQLLYSAKDAQDFARALEIGATKFLGRDKVHIRLLTTAGQEAGKALSGSDSTVLDATKENFRQTFAEFAGKAKQNDMLVVYLSGHGLALKLNQNPSQPAGDSYLFLTREAYTTEASALGDEEIRSATSVSGDELVRWIKEIAAQSKALVLDTCAAGAAAETLIARKDEPLDMIKIRAVDRLKDTTGFFILMGSAGDKVSYEATPYRQGLLTYSLLEALKGARLHDGGYANVGQLFGYAQDRVPLIARNLGLSQQPRFLAPDVGSPFDVGLYTAEEQKLFTLPSPNPLILRPLLLNKDLGRDNLQLLPILNRALLEASYVNPRGGQQASLVFVDTSEMLDAFTPSGLYTVAGSQITVSLNLIRNEQPAARLTVEGVVTDEQSKIALVQKLVAAISEAAQKLVH